jgi:glycerol-3-phosphate O-acyltransferase
MIYLPLHLSHLDYILVTFIFSDVAIFIFTEGSVKPHHIVIYLNTAIFKINVSPPVEPHYIVTYMNT